MGEGRIGIDFGGTALKAGLVEDGRVVDRRSRSTPRQGPAAIMEALAELVHLLDPQPSGVGLAIPGEVDDSGRCWRLPNVPGFEGFGLADDLERRLGCPVRVENDATAAALAELRFGHGDDHPSFVLFTLGTGVGGGLALAGQLRRGRHGFAGELGHLLVDSGEDAWPCGCGLRGCLEARAGTQGLQRAWREAAGAPEGTEAPTPAALAAAARRDDEAALAAFQTIGEALGIALAGIQNVLDLDAAIYTGGISASFDLIQPSLRRSLRLRAFAPPLAELPLLVSELGGDAGVVGAAELLR